LCASSAAASEAVYSWCAADIPNPLETMADFHQWESSLALTVEASVPAPP
jgi:hypothetical protein